MKLWRVARAAHAATGAAAFSGRGGLVADGRWHTRGRLVVYTARSESLARLEALAHVGLLAPRLVLVEAEMPDDAVVRLREIPKGWDDVPDSGRAHEAGDAWLAGGASLALEVPSLHSRSETNMLVNPAHTGFARLRIGKPSPLVFDPRLLRRR